MKTAIATRYVYGNVICRVFGHRFDNFNNLQGVNQCSCGTQVFREVGAETRIRHVVSCFLFGHSYVRIGERHGHYEYACRVCGHPLLVEEGRRVYADLKSLHKNPRYLCNLFGHKKVHKIVERNGFTEYACYCGHSFLKPESGMTEVKHPLICLFAGHFVRFVTWRAKRAEYMCRNCGHTFYFPTS